MSARHSTEAELDALVVVCERLAGFDPRVSAEWLDGYLTLLAAGPRVPELDEALARMFDDTWSRTFADPDDASRALAAVQARWRALRSQLDPELLWDHPDALHLAPLLLEPGEPAEAPLGADWIAGAMDALQEPTWGWAPPEDVSDEAYAQALQRLQSAAASAEADPDSPPRETLIDEACYALQDLRLWWMVNAPRTAPRRVEASPGRNDPCPCGSGKKFKKCHGAA